MENLLVIAPHPDDEVLGAGGFIRKISEKGGQVTVLTVSGHLPPLYSKKSTTPPSGKLQKPTKN